MWKSLAYNSNSNAVRCKTPSCITLHLPFMSALLRKPTLQSAVIVDRQHNTSRSDLTWMHTLHLERLHFRYVIASDRE